jgi:hypothetical protein
MFQLCFTLLFMPLVSIPGFGGVPFKQLPMYMICGAYCFGTRDSRFLFGFERRLIFVCVLRGSRYQPDAK